MKKLLGVIFVLIIGAGNAFGLHEIDRVELMCINSTSKYNEMFLCTQTAHKAWDAEITKQLNLLKRDLEKADLKKLLSSQRRWERYANAEFDLIDAILHQKPNLMNKNISAGLKKDIVKQRATYLEEYHELFHTND